ncbi:MAG TPA: GNAT family protein [Limnobacter sp.]|nr:GNAT family protein [Limnobacter sp.]
MKLNQPLHGEHIFLDCLDPSRVDDRYLSWLHNPLVNQHLEVRLALPGAVQDIQEFVASTNASDHSLLLGIHLAATGLHIGNIKLGPINAYHGTADVGLFIGEQQQWGKGYASQAIGLLTQHAFDALGLLKLTASCYASNLGSKNAFVKAGWQQEGIRLSQFNTKAGREDCIMLGKVKT